MTDNERIQAIRNRVSARDFMYWSGGHANEDVEFLLEQNLLMFSMLKGLKRLVPDVEERMLSMYDQLDVPFLTDIEKMQFQLLERVLNEVEGGST